MHITVLGAGYVGLVSAACFAEFGHKVTCIDTNAARVARLQKADIPIFEPGLDKLVAKNLRNGTLAFAGALVCNGTATAPNWTNASWRTV